MTPSASTSAESSIDTTKLLSLLCFSTRIDIFTCFGQYTCLELNYELQSHITHINVCKNIPKSSSKIVNTHEIQSVYFPTPHKPSNHKNPPSKLCLTYSLNLKKKNYAVKTANLSSFLPWLFGDIFPIEQDAVLTETSLIYFSQVLSLLFLV